ncbi:MAG: very short patch repair endonuclease [Nitrospiraceae bacterium]|nr:very short patch repair endonuclease [Nitrospiraceae bacterium]
MADVLTPEQRRYCMSRIRGRDTGPEMIVRRIAHGLGYRYRLHDRRLPGTPDLVFKSRRKIIFVHGCYWHMHDCPAGRVAPATRAEFWRTKREGNVERDRRSMAALKKDGWKVLVIWECETRDEKKITGRLRSFLK